MFPAHLSHPFRRSWCLGPCWPVGDKLFVTSGEVWTDKGCATEFCAKVTSVSGTDARFAEIYGSYFKYVHAYCRRRVSVDQVDDTVSDVFVIVWRKADEIPESDEVLIWLYGIARGVVSNLWRGGFRLARLRKKLNSAGLEYLPPPDDVVVKRQEAQQILKALETLKEDDQELLRLSIWEELSVVEISKVLGISVDATKQRLSRARKELARKFDNLDSKTLRPSVAQQGGAE